jgi:hypothetical protein
MNSHSILGIYSANQTIPKEVMIILISHIISLQDVYSLHINPLVAQEEKEVLCNSYL